jgi:protein SCO1/2
MKHFLVTAIFVTLFASCIDRTPRALPILGRHEFNDTESGKDTVYHTIKPFEFVDQDSIMVTNATYRGKIYVADFFFTSCPSICPIMKVQMLRVYEEFKDDSTVMLLSHTIDPEYDNVAVLHDYANRMEVNSAKWHFVTGEKPIIYDMAQTSYYVATRENDQAPGGFEHSGAFILVDNHRRIRGVYDGTKEEAVDKLIADIKTLLIEVNE